MLKKKITVPEVIPMVQVYCKNNPTGGSLHMVLANKNVDDSAVRYCLTYAKEQGDPEGETLASVLLGLSKTQRLKLANFPVK